MAKKKVLNDEVAYYIAGLKIAIGLDKEAMVVWHDGYMIAPTGTGTIFIPCNFSVNVAVRAQDLVNALNGCDSTFTITEQINQVAMSWGRKRATLASKPRVSVYVRPRDAIDGQSGLAPQFTQVLRSCLKDLPVTQQSTYSQVIKFAPYAAYWTNTTTAAKIDTGVWMPDVLLWVKDLRNALTKEGDIVAIYGSATSLTLYWADGVAIQLPLVDDSTVKLPSLEFLFTPDLHEAEYELTDEHLDAFEYVAKFAEQVIYIEPTFIGTTDKPETGTVVMTDGLPIQTQIFVEAVKLGAFKHATSLIKAKHRHNAVAFITKRENFMFVLTRAKRQ